MLRNKELRRLAIIFTALSVLIITTGCLLSQAAGILAACACAVFGATFYLFTKARYRAIAQISQQIDRVLHNEDRFDLGDFDEGELAILHNEITKMTLRIREQNDALINDKQHLADSLADIAHQLRTPLTSANLILSFLEKNPAEHERQTFVRELEELLMRMDWLITSLLKLSRLDADVVVFQSEPIKVQDLLQSALRPLAIPFELHNINVRLDIPEDAIIKGDAGWLSEAVQNILKNCMESVGECGEISIYCGENALCCELIIRDNGAGFDEADVPRLFDRFYRGKSVGATGYGIGLALCKMIITRQGAAITAKNHPDGGAVFTLSFPR